MSEFLMPKLGADMTAGTLVAWKKQPGDAVQRGDIVAEVDTDKGVIDIEIFTSGVLDKLLVQPGNKVPVGSVLAIVRETSAAEQPRSNGTTVGTPRPPEIAVAAPSGPIHAASIGLPAATGKRLAISPAARRLAREKGVRPETITGTGHGGAITLEDVERAATSPTARPPVVSTTQPATVAKPPDTDRYARMRQSIAAAMTRSKREIPHYYLSTTIDLHAATTWLAEENLRRSLIDRLLYGVLLLKATALALREVPELNSTWDGERLVQSDSVHLGVAIALRQGGLIAPALHNADRLTLSELMQKFRDLVQRARSGALRSTELSDPTITVTSLGEQGVETAFGVIYPPQVAIVGFGKVVERPWAVNGQVMVRPVITATLSADHRVTDGHRGGLFLTAVDRLLQEPSKL